MGAYFEEMGFALDALSLSLQYCQLQANPCAFQPYYVGYEEIRALRRQAEEELGEDFSQLDFHQALLKRKAGQKDAKDPGRETGTKSLADGTDPVPFQSV